MNDLYDPLNITTHTRTHTHSTDFNMHESKNVFILLFILSSSLLPAEVCIDLAYEEHDWLLLLLYSCVISVVRVHNAKEMKNILH